MPFGAYIHIPFCNYKCNFCDFATSLRINELQEKYCNVLGQEIHERLDNFSIKPVLETIFYGGGTPGLLDINYLKHIHDNLLSKIALVPDAEITLETTPETITIEKAQQWLKLGINRLSIGIESFNDFELTTMGRGYSAQVAISAINNACKAGFINISCDLMCGLPKQTLDMWQNSLSIFVQLASQFSPIKHLSAYGLELHESTPLAKIFPHSSGVYPSDDVFVQQQKFMINILCKAGFEQYEISNFAKSGFESKHNLNYWLGGEYFAFGVSAHRYLKPYRSSNWRSLTHYLKDYMGNETYELIDKQTQIKEAIMLGLRMTKGINLKRFEQSFNFNLALEHKELIEKLTSHNMLTYTNDELKLTEKSQTIANLIIGEFF